MILHPSDDPNVSADYSLMDIEGEIERLEKLPPGVVGHYRDRAADIAARLFEVAAKSPRETTTCESQAHGKAADITGRRFGRLIVEGRSGTGGKNSTWQVRCDCGARGVVRRSSLTAGATRSCGCIGREVTAARSTVHGDAHAAEYAAWSGAKSRCHNPKVSQFPRYGGRGISMADEWLNGDGALSGYECFIRDMGRRPSVAHSLERDDVNGPYAKGNCRWATAKEQARNRQGSVYLTIGGERKHVSEWAELSGISRPTLLWRSRHNWPGDRMLTPALPRRRR